MTVPDGRSVRRALWTGLGLQLLVIVLPVLDGLLFGSVEAQVARTYPDWGTDLVAADRIAIVGTLVVVGLLGLVGWAVALWVTRNGGGRATVPVLFAIGALTAVTVATAGGEPYDRFVPLWLGLTGLLPSLAGVAAVVAVWRTRGRTGASSVPDRVENGPGSRSVRANR